MFTKKSKVGVTLHQEDGYYYLLNIVAVGGDGGVDLFCIMPSRCLEEEEDGGGYGEGGQGVVLMKITMI